MAGNGIRIHIIVDEGKNMKEEKKVVGLGDVSYRSLSLSLRRL